MPSKNVLPPLATLYHEAGHLVVAKRARSVMCGIEFFPSGHPFGAIGIHQWTHFKCGLKNPLLADVIAVKVAGIHAQEIFAPESLSEKVRAVLATSAFYCRSHTLYGSLTTHERAELDVAMTDLETAKQTACSRFGHGGQELESYLRRREREVRRFLRIRDVQRRVKTLVAAVQDWFSKDGPTQEPHFAFYPGSYCCFPGLDVEKALR